MRLVPTRQDLYGLFAQGGTGIELGVHTGKNAAVLLDVARPQTLWLVDTWTPGEFLYDGVDIRIDGAEAHDICAVRFRDEPRVKLAQGDAAGVLATFPDGTFDWAYIDSSHRYHETRALLDLLARKTKPDGVIAGHDFCHEFQGVPLAVRHFTETGPWRLATLTTDERWPSFALRIPGRP